MTGRWEILARQGAQREAALRRYFRRIHPKPIVNYGAHLRQQKRWRHIDRDCQRLRLRSVIAAASVGVEAEQWQDVYYGEIERLGEHAPAGVKARWATQDPHQ